MIIPSNNPDVHFGINCHWRALIKTRKIYAKNTSKAFFSTHCQENKWCDAPPKKIYKKKTPMLLNDPAVVQMYNSFHAIIQESQKFECISLGYEKSFVRWNKHTSELRGFS